METQKLYRVTLRGLRHNSGGGVIYGISYSVAKDPTEAYEKVYNYLKKKDYGFDRDRALEKVELIAEDYDFTDIQTRLFL